MCVCVCVCVRARACVPKTLCSAAPFFASDTRCACCMRRCVQRGVYLCSMYDMSF